MTADTVSITLGNILVTSASRKVPCIRALQAAVRRIDASAMVVAGDRDAAAPARHIADEFWHMSPLDAVQLPALAEECRARDIRTILPTRDGELAFWANARSALSDMGVGVIVSMPLPLSRCVDKLAFAEWGAAKELAIIPAALEAEAFDGGRVVVKERFGAGSRGIGLDLNIDAARVHAAAMAAPIFQPWVPGPEISIDAFLSRTGGVHGLVLRRRDRVVSGESQITTTFRDSELEAQAAAILGETGLNGPVVMQAILTDRGLAVIEVNPRFGGASTASIAVGLDVFYWALLERLHPDMPLPAFERSTGEIRQVRVPEDIIIHDPDF